MKAVRIANLQAVAFSELITIVRGDAAFSIRKSELSDLLAVLRELGGEDEPVGPTPITVEELHVESVDTASAPLVALRAHQLNGVHNGKRRRGVWSEVRAFLRSCQRAQGRMSIARHLRRAHIVEGDVDLALGRVLDTRLKSGDIIITKSGRYRLTSH